MRKLIPLALIPTGLLVTTGCSVFTPQWEGVWFLDVPVMDESECDPVVSENFTKAEEPVAGDDGPWTIIDEATLSNNAFFIEVLEGKQNKVFVVIDDEVYPGTQDKNTLTVTWKGSTDEEHAENHEDGYDFSRVVLSETETTITLTRAEGGTATGKMSVLTSSSTEYSETDRWQVNRVGLSYSQLPNWLVGDAPVNIPDSVECAADLCTMSVEQECDGEVQFAATFAGRYENGMFTGISGASQSAGDNGATTF